MEGLNIHMVIYTNFDGLHQVDMSFKIYIYLFETLL